MPGTRAGGIHAAKTNKERHGDGFYKRIGQIGGRTKPAKPRGFAANPELARHAGAKGGRRSKRDKSKQEIIESHKDEIVERYFEKQETAKSIAEDFDVQDCTIRYYVGKWREEA